MSPQPIIVIGAARSGTRYLRSLVSTALGCAEVPYDINYVWRHGNETLPHDELTPGDVSERATRHVRRHLQHVVDRAVADDPSLTSEFVVEKTVANALRLPMVQAVLPSARFVVIERDGHQAVESTHRSWTQPLSPGYLAGKAKQFTWRDWRYAVWFGGNQITSRRRGTTPLWGPRYEGMTADLSELGTAVTCARQWATSVERARATLPVDCYRIHFDHLRDPDRLSGLLDWLGVDTGGRHRISDLTSPWVTSGRSWPGTIPEADRDRCDEIIRAVGPATTFGALV